MKKFKSVLVFGICMALFLGPLGALDLSGQEPEYVWKSKKRITPQFKIPSEHQVPVTNWLVSANNRLEAIIRQLPNMDDHAISALIAQCNSDDTEHGFGRTYLRVPVLESESGEVYIGWEEVIWRLKEIADTFQGLGNVNIDAVPFAPEQAQKMDANFRVEVSTELIFNPSTYLLRGCGIHRTSCTSDPC